MFLKRLLLLSLANELSHWRLSTSVNSVIISQVNGLSPVRHINQWWFVVDCIGEISIKIKTTLIHGNLVCKISTTVFRFQCVKELQIDGHMLPWRCEKVTLRVLTGEHRLAGDDVASCYDRNVWIYTIMCNKHNYIIIIMISFTSIKWYFSATFVNVARMIFTNIDLKYQASFRIWAHTMWKGVTM